MTTAIHLEKLTIQAFRGYGAKADFDFRAPLTVIYAANGTGKTSLCDATEWLLTSKVDRLDLTKGEQIDKGLRCRFSPDATPTMVDALIRTDKGSGWLRRTSEGASIRQPKGNFEAIGDADLLRKLVGWKAPRGLSPTVETTQRRRWLWASRFYSTDTIAPLIDGGRDEEIREQVFADLLGTSELLAQEKKLNNVLKEIRPNKSAREVEIARLDRRVTELLDQAPPDQTAILIAGASACSRIEEMLGAGTAERTMAVTTPEQLFTLRNAAERQLKAAVQQQSDLRVAFDTVAASIDSYQSNKDALNKTREAQRYAEIKLKKIQHDFDDILKKNDANRLNLKRQQEKLRKDENDLRLIVERVAKLDDNISISAQIEQLPLCKIEINALRQRADLVQLCLNELLNFNHAQREVEQITITLASLPSEPTKEELQQLFEQVAKANVRRREAQAAFDAAAEPLQLLRHYADQILPLLSSHGECPTCGHDWGDAKSLQSAIQRDRIKASTILTELARELADAESEANTLSAQREMKCQIQDQFRRLSDDLRKNNQLISNFLEHLDKIELKYGDHNLGHTLREMDAQLGKAIRLRVIEELCSNFDRRDLLLKTPEEIISAPSQLTRLIGQVGREIEKNIADFSERQHRYLMDETESAHHVATIKKLAIDIEDKIRPIESAWRRLAGDDILTTNAIQKAKEQIEKRDASIIKAEYAFKEMDVAVHQLEKHAEIEKVRRELAQAKDKHDRFTSEEDRLSRLRDRLEMHRQALTHSQITSLNNSINDLYARIQANEVFDRIGNGFGEGESPLQWHAKAKNIQLNPTLHFSQGQRQDLSLSVFLARAINLGGTFFLDEPFQHLDDLNRAALLDTLRTISLDGVDQLRLVVTTSNRSLLDHLVEKCRRMRLQADVSPFLRIYELEGNPRVGTSIHKELVFGDR